MAAQRVRHSAYGVLRTKSLVQQPTPQAEAHPLPVGRYLHVYALSWYGGLTRLAEGGREKRGVSISQNNPGMGF